MCFEWTEEKVKLLIFGVVRDTIDGATGSIIVHPGAIPDVSSIIIYYLKDTFCNYHINNSKYSNIKYLSNNNIICNLAIKILQSYHIVLQRLFLRHIFQQYLIIVMQLKQTKK